MIPMTVMPMTMMITMMIRVANANACPYYNLGHSAAKRKYGKQDN
jgi:hypothetical protein